MSSFSTTKIVGSPICCMYFPFSMQIQSYPENLVLIALVIFSTTYQLDCSLNLPLKNFFQPYTNTLSLILQHGNNNKYEQV
jgi:hypothetical protein